jgi:hypothetical protein
VSTCAGEQSSWGLQATRLVLYQSGNVVSSRTAATVVSSGALQSVVEQLEPVR